MLAFELPDALPLQHTAVTIAFPSKRLGYCMLPCFSLLGPSGHLPKILFMQICMPFVRLVFVWMG